MVFSTASIADNNTVGWRFDNTYSRLPDVLFSPAKPATVRAPRVALGKPRPCRHGQARRGFHTLEPPAARRGQGVWDPLAAEMTGKTASARAAAWRIRDRRPGMAVRSPVRRGQMDHRGWQSCSWKALAPPAIVPRGCHNVKRAIIGRPPQKTESILRARVLRLEK